MPVLSEAISLYSKKIPSMKISMVKERVDTQTVQIVYTGHIRNPSL